VYDVGYVEREKSRNFWGAGRVTSRIHLWYRDRWGVIILQQRVWLSRNSIRLSNGLLLLEHYLVISIILLAILFSKRDEYMGNSSDRTPLHRTGLLAHDARLSVVHWDTQKRPYIVASDFYPRGYPVAIKDRLLTNWNHWWVMSDSKRRPLMPGAYLFHVLKWDYFPIS
jgi:hypothetical protein